MSEPLRGFIFTDLTPDLTPSDRAEGIVGRWRVRDPGISWDREGHTRHIIQVKAGTGRWAGPSRLLCSCSGDVATEDCEHRQALRELLDRQPRTPAA